MSEDRARLHNAEIRRIPLSKVIGSLHVLAAMATLFSVLPAKAAEVEILGRSELGVSSQFEFGDARLTRVVNGTPEPWELPAGVRPVQIEYTFEVNGEELLPWMVSDSGDLYKGVPPKRKWTRVDRLPGVEPGRTVEGRELLAADPFRPGLMFWMWDGRIWAARNAGLSWSLIGTTSAGAGRLVLTPVGELVAISNSGYVTRGQVEVEGEDEMNSRVVWNAQPSGFVALPGESIEVAQDGYRIWGHHGEPRLTSSPLRSPSRISPADQHFEFSTRAATTVRGCEYRIERRDWRGWWIRDNYWDVNWRQNDIRIRFVKTSGPSNCVWQAPFRARRVEIRDASFRNRVTGGYPGEFGIRILQNVDGDPLVRAIGLHVANPGYYTNANRNVILRPASGDNWAVVLQNSRTANLTACEVLRNAASFDQARAAGRLYMDIEVTGSNAQCPMTSTRAIGCTSRDRSFFASASQAFASFSLLGYGERSAQGMAECILPDVDN